MVSVADSVTGHVVELLMKKGMWDNNIFVVSAVIASMSAHCLHHSHTIVHVQVPQLVLVVAVELMLQQVSRIINQ